MDTQQSSHNQTDTYCSLFASLGDPIRYEILRTLRGGERTVNELAARFPVSRPAISKHLRILKAAGAVKERRAGRHHFLSLAPAVLVAAGSFLFEIAQRDRSPRPGTPRTTGDWAPYLRR